MGDLGKKSGSLLVKYSPLRLQVGCACCPPPPPPPPPPPDVCGCDTVQEIEDLLGQYYAPMTLTIERSDTGIPTRVTGSYTQAQSDWITSNVSATVVLPFAGISVFPGTNILGASWFLREVSGGMYTEARIFMPCDTPPTGTPLAGFVYYERGEDGLAPGTGTQVGDKFFLSVSFDFPASTPWDAAWTDYPTLRQVCEGTPQNWFWDGVGGIVSEVTLPVAAEFDCAVSFGAI